MEGRVLPAVLTDKLMLQVISLMLENKPGALMRVTGLLSQRGYNIESLTVARTLDPEVSRMTIVVDVEDAQRAQVIKQMNRLINVLQAVDLTDSPAVVRELVLVRVRTSQETRTAVLKEAEIFGGRVADSSTEGFAIEVTGDPEKLNAFIDVMRSYGEIDVTRSGSLAITLETKRLKLQPPVPTRGMEQPVG
jgi:acetolactate synthase-1/3 small subunit